MIKIEKTEVCGWESAIRGMRNPMNSHDKSDSHNCMVAYGYDDCPMIFESYHDDDDEPCKECNDGKYGFCIGVNDFDLMKNLSEAGTDHRKFMRMIVVYADITAPLYWWKEFDTYKVGTVANSCSTMHKIHAKEFTMDDFSHEDLPGEANEAMRHIVDLLNIYRELYVETKNKAFWRNMIQLLPSSYNQKRTVMMNYEVLANIYKARKNHKLDEWKDLCKWIEGLPYSELITG